MKRKITIALSVVFVAIVGALLLIGNKSDMLSSLTNSNKKDMATIYDFKPLNNRGEEVDMSQYKGKVLLIVNTASKCGFTPQYKGLQELYDKYKDQGLVVIGFPCDQFAHQEPGSDEEIAQFCELNFGVNFPLMKKIDVNGDKQDPLFAYLKAQTKGFLTDAIKWNFTKFLVSKDGEKIIRYAPTTKPEDIDAEIRHMLR